MYRKYLKRPLDCVVALILGILTLPICLIVAIAIKLEDPEGPVLFTQDRVGKKGEIFRIYKFRSMRAATTKAGIKIADDARLTRIGVFLRKTSIDELPQLFNILKGDMSFIGPRPLFVKYVPFYTEEEFKRHNVLPGISGWAQVNGRNTLDWNKRFVYDLEYVNDISLMMDLRILLLTICRVFKRSNIEINALPDLDDERATEENERCTSHQYTG